MGKHNPSQNRVHFTDSPSSPAAQSVINQANATGNEFSDLANSRKMPEHTAANNTPLTRMFGPETLPVSSNRQIDYHSFFFNLLSWRNPSKCLLFFNHDHMLILYQEPLQSLLLLPSPSFSLPDTFLLFVSPSKVSGPFLVVSLFSNSPSEYHT